MLTTAFIQGFGVSAGLIIAIGAQNAHVLSLGIRQQHPMAAALICSFFDAILIIAGVLGMGLLLEQFPSLNLYASLGGALFLGIYGVRALRSAAFPGTLTPSESELPGSLKLVVISTLMVTLLNPHVYLDTMILIGTVGGRYSATDQLLFIAGAALASCSWFFTLAWGGRKLRPLFSSPGAWRILDLIVAMTMLTLSVLLLQSAFSQ